MSYLANDPSIPSPLVNLPLLKGTRVGVMRLLLLLLLVRVMMIRRVVAAAVPAWQRRCILLKKVATELTLLLWLFSCQVYLAAPSLHGVLHTALNAVHVCVFYAVPAVQRGV